MVCLVNYLACGIIFSDFSYQRKKKFFSDAKYYQWEDPLLYKYCANQIVRRCIPEEEMGSTYHCHSRKVGGRVRPTRTAAKVLQYDFYWPTLFKDAHAFLELCNAWQWSGNISRKNEMPLNNIIEVELFDV